MSIAERYTAGSVGPPGMDARPFSVDEILFLIDYIRAKSGKAPDGLYLSEGQVLATSYQLDQMIQKRQPWHPGVWQLSVKKHTSQGFVGARLNNVVLFTHQFTYKNIDDNSIAWGWEGEASDPKNIWHRGQISRRETSTDYKVNPDGSLVKNEYNKDSGFEFL